MTKGPAAENLRIRPRSHVSRDVGRLITDSTAGRNHPAVEPSRRSGGGPPEISCAHRPSRTDGGPFRQPPRTVAIAAVTSSIEAMPSTVFSSPVEA